MGKPIPSRDLDRQPTEDPTAQNCIGDGQHDLAPLQNGTRPRVPFCSGARWAVNVGIDKFYARDKVYVIMYTNDWSIR